MAAAHVLNGRYKDKPVRAATDLLSNAVVAIQRAYGVELGEAREVIAEGFVNWLELQLAGRDDAEVIARDICREILSGAALAKKLHVLG